jgi:oligopeptide/dipeptide ABC transporter ATP-binding protein
MLQRALIAVVVALEPDLLIADEPTTNLDNVVERGILALLRDHQRRSGAGLLFITHDLTLARDLCDRIAVMYAGEIVETGRTRDVLDAPRHPYTQALLATARSLEAGDAVLAELPGEPGAAPASGCRFSGRCPRAQPPCRSADPPLAALPGPHLVRCVYPHD